MRDILTDIVTNRNFFDITGEAVTFAFFVRTSVRLMLVLNYKVSEYKLYIPFGLKHLQGAEI